MYQLSKKKNKITSEINEKRLQTEYKTGILRCKKILDNWNPDAMDNFETYHKLYKTLTEYDKHFAFCYDYMSGSKYLNVIALQLADKVGLKGFYR
ncbi:MAG: hypothetical protein PWP52_119 [Bacteroidales bacterium]|nr:hypothetical protein [Bacteroidales bacterium]